MTFHLDPEHIRARLIPGGTFILDDPEHWRQSVAIEFIEAPPIPDTDTEETTQ